MSVSADTSATAPFTFATVDDRKIGFRARFLSRRDRAAHRRLIDAATGKNLDDDEGFWKPVREAIELGIVGWDLDKPYSYDALEGELTERDLWLLAQLYVDALNPTEAERGKSRSQRLLLAEPSATDVPPQANA